VSGITFTPADQAVTIEADVRSIPEHTLACVARWRAGLAHRIRPKNDRRSKRRRTN